MTTRRVAFGLGSNLGDRGAHLRRAVAGLRDSDLLTGVVVSSVYETDPVGGPEQGPYLNAVVVADSPASPESLLVLARRLETEAGRARDVRWGPRTLDVDVLAVGDVVRAGAELMLPHPRVPERAFVLVPWAEVDPEFVVVGRGRVAALAAAAGGGGVRLAQTVIG